MRRSFRRLPMILVFASMRLAALPACFQRATQSGKIAEILLETGRRNDLKHPARRIGRVPKGVPLVARLEDEFARPSLDNLIA